MAGLHRRHAIDQALLEFDARLPRELRLGVGVGKQQVLVAGDQRVDAGHLAQIARAVLHGGRVGRGHVDAAVRQRHDQVSAGRLHFGHIALRGFLPAGDFHIAFQVGLVPLHDGRRGKADHADLQRDVDALAAGVHRLEALVQQHPGLEDGLLGRGRHHVGGHEGELGGGAVLRAGRVGLRRALA
ncbi:hypothetical protein D3C87_1429640 [compost metagenome]